MWKSRPRKRLQDLRGLIRANPDQGCRVLESVLDGPLTFPPTNIPDGTRRYLITGKALGAKALFTTGSDPNGISSVGNPILKVLTLLPEPPPLRLCA